MIGTVKMLAPDTSISATALPKGPPEGYGPLVHAPAGLETLAKGLLVEPYGARALFKGDGILYMARLEPHPPAPARGLPTWHKGVTVYQAVQGTASPWAPVLVMTVAGGIGYALARMFR